MLKSDRWIIEKARAGMIDPFNDSLVNSADGGQERKVSFGPSSYGYDIRLAPEFKVFTNANQHGNAGIVDPKAFDDNNFIHYEGDAVIVPPNSFVLGRTVEYLRMPDNVTALVMNKSTYARCGLNCLTTVIEAGWKGELVLEFANSTPLPIRLYANEGCAQLLFFESNEPCLTTYADRKGKYQGQTGVQTAIT